MGGNKKNKNKPTPRNNQSVIAVQKAEMFSGPIPPPQILEGYESIVPGAAERILTMAENQTKHRIEMEKKVIESKIADSRRGTIFGFLIVLLAMGIGTLLIIYGYSVIGLSSILVPVGGIIGAFIYGTHSGRKEREEKQQENE